MKREDSKEHFYEACERSCHNFDFIVKKHTFDRRESPYDDHARTMPPPIKALRRVDNFAS